MSEFAAVTIRPVEPADLETFYQQQLDPGANWMAAFVGKEPRNPVTFAAHWAKILQSPQNNTRTIEAAGQVAGHVACYLQDGHREVTYWLGREFWGRGIATAALIQLLPLEVERPVFARVATDNAGSIRVLQKCGFKITGTDKGFADGRGAVTEEYILRLDPNPAKE